MAEILESKYQIMAKFFNLHHVEVIQALEGGVEGQLEAIMMGAGVSDNPFLEGESEIERVFKDFINARELDGVVNGVPTDASLKGVNHSFLHPYAKSNPVRPSFVDTGLYRDSFKAWIDDVN